MQDDAVDGLQQDRVKILADQVDELHHRQMSVDYEAAVLFKHRIVRAIGRLDRFAPEADVPDRDGQKDISISFGGIKAVDHVSLDLYAGEVLGLVGHNGAGKTVLIKILAGALKRDEGAIRINGKKVRINKPSDAKAHGIETIYQTLALADNVDTASNLYLGRELLTSFGTLDDLSMEAGARDVMGRLNPRFRRFHEPVRALSGGQRQSVAIPRAILFNERILIMDEPTAALGPEESAQVPDLIKQLTAQGISIILISHDMHDVFCLVDRVTVMKNGRIVGTAAIDDVTAEEVLGMIILGKCAPKATPVPGATSDVEYRFEEAEHEFREQMRERA